VARGLQLLARNLNYRFGEIDLLMRDGDTLAFVEVRLRAPSVFGDGAVSVGPAKRRKLALAAQAWLAENPNTRSRRAASMWSR
jgi:putative endonuclease